MAPTADTAAHIRFQLILTYRPRNRSHSANRIVPSAGGYTAAGTVRNCVRNLSNLTRITARMLHYLITCSASCRMGGAVNRTFPGLLSCTGMAPIHARRMRKPFPVCPPSSLLFRPFKNNAAIQCGARKIFITVAAVETKAATHCRTITGLPSSKPVQL